MSREASGGDEDSEDELREFFGATQLFQETQAVDETDEIREGLLLQFLDLGLSDAKVEGDAVGRLRPIIRAIVDQELDDNWSAPVKNRLLQNDAISKNDLRAIQEALGYSFGDSVANQISDNTVDEAYEQEIQQEQEEDRAEDTAKNAEDEQVERQAALEKLGRNSNIEYSSEIQALENQYNGLRNARAKKEAGEKLARAYERTTVQNGSTFFREVGWGKLETALFSEDAPSLDQIVAAPSFRNVLFYRRDGDRGIPLSRRATGSNVYCAAIRHAFQPDGETHTDSLNPVALRVPGRPGMLSGTTMEGPNVVDCYPVADVANAVREETKETIIKYLAVMFQSTGAVEDDDFSLEIEELETPFVESVSALIKLYAEISPDTGGDDSDDDSDDDDEADDDDEEYKERRRLLRKFGTVDAAMLRGLLGYTDRRIVELDMLGGTTMQPTATENGRKALNEDKQLIQRLLANPAAINGNDRAKLGAMIDYPFKSIKFLRALRAHRLLYAGPSEVREIDDLLADPIEVDEAIDDLEPSFPTETLTLVRELFRRISGVELPQAKESRPEIDIIGGLETKVLTRRQVVAKKTEFTIGMLADYQGILPYTRHMAAVNEFPNIEVEFNTLLEVLEDEGATAFLNAWATGSEELMPALGIPAYGAGETGRMKSDLTRAYNAALRDNVDFQQRVLKTAAEVAVDRLMGAVDPTPVVLNVEGVEKYAVYGTLDNPGSTTRVYVGNVATIGGALVYVHNTYTRNGTVYVQFSNNVGETQNVSKDFPEDLDYLDGIVGTQVTIMPRIFPRPGPGANYSETSIADVELNLTIATELRAQIRGLKNSEDGYELISRWEHEPAALHPPSDVFYDWVRRWARDDNETLRQIQAEMDATLRGLTEIRPTGVRAAAWVDFAGTADLGKVASATGGRAREMTARQLQALVRSEGKTPALLGTLKTKQLRQLLKMEGKRVNGNKSQLIERLVSGKARYKSPHFVPAEWDDDEWWARQKRAKATGARLTEAETQELLAGLEQRGGRTRANLTALTIPQLKAILRADRKALGGNKAALIDRILGVEAAAAPAARTPAPPRPTRVAAPPRTSNTAREKRIQAQLESMFEAFVEYPIREICREFNLSIPHPAADGERGTTGTAADAGEEEDDGGDDLEAELADLNDATAVDEAESTIDELPIDEQFAKLNEALEADDVGEFYALLEDADAELGVEANLSDAGQLSGLLRAAYEKATAEEEGDDDDAADSEDEENYSSVLDGGRLTFQALLDSTIDMLEPAKNAVVAVSNAEPTSEKLKKLAFPTVEALENVLNKTLQPELAGKVVEPWRHHEFGRTEAVQLWNARWWRRSYGCMESLPSKGNLAIADLTPDELLGTLDRLLDRIADSGGAQAIGEMQGIMKFTNMLKILEASLVSRAIAVFGGEDDLGATGELQFGYHSWTSTRLDFVRAFMGKITDVVCGAGYSRTGSAYSSTAVRKLARWQSVLAAWGVKERLPADLFAESVRMVFFPQLGYYPASMDEDAPILTKLPAVTEMWRFQIYESRANRVRDQLIGRLQSRRVVRGTAGGYADRALAPAN